MSARNVQAGPRTVPLLNRFPGNVRQDLLQALLGDLWESLQGHLVEPIHVEEDNLRRKVTFMGAARFTTNRRSRRISVSQLRQLHRKVVLVEDKKDTVIDLPCRLNGFWLEAFLVPWGDRIAECLIDHRAAGSDLSWNAALERELLCALGRSANWYRLRCRLRDALQLDPKILHWCRKGRPASKNYITHTRYNSTLALRSTYQRIEADNPNLIWLYNVLGRACFSHAMDLPVAAMKSWLLRHPGVCEAGWRLVANAKEQDFRHIIDFCDANGATTGRKDYVPDWLRLLCKLRRIHPVPRPLAALFSHDAYDGMRTEAGDRVKFRGVLLQPGVLRAILAEGERRLANGSHRRFIEEDLVEALAWLQAEQPVFDKNQLRQGWKYVTARAVSWRVEREASGTLKGLSWESLLPPITIGQWRVVPLTDAWQLRREALTRRLCADQFIDACIAGTCRLFSVQSIGGRSVATIGIEQSGGDWCVFGFRGFANQPVREDLAGLEDEVLRRYADMSALVTAARLWNAEHDKFPTNDSTASGCPL